MQIEKGVTYWGHIGKNEIYRRVNLIETRSSGTQYVNYTNKKKSGSDGASGWAKRSKFETWAKGIYEKESVV